jgi:hypothetical protein
MDEMQRALEADGEKLRQLTGEDHGPFKICGGGLAGDAARSATRRAARDKRVQSLAILIAVEIAKQDADIDNLGDCESIVFMGKCPMINLVQLAEKIDAYCKLDAAEALKKRIAELEIDLELAQHDAREGHDS